MSIIAGGVTYSIVLAVFPALAAFVALYGLVADVNSVRDQIDALSALLPRDILQVIGEEMMRLAKCALRRSFADPDPRRGGLAVERQRRDARDDGRPQRRLRGTEKRGFFKQIGVSMALTMGLLLFAAAASVALGAGALVQRLSRRRRRPPHSICCAVAAAAARLHRRPLPPLPVRPMPAVRAVAVDHLGQRLRDACCGSPLRRPSPSTSRISPIWAAPTARWPP